MNRKLTRHFKVVFSGLLVVALGACGGQNDSKPLPEEKRAVGPGGPGTVAEITFDTLDHDFGTIIEGEQVVCYFDYHNTGNADLLISSVEATCGCTIPDWNSEPLAPGQTASLKIIFDSSGREGVQRKVVTVKSNAVNPMIRLSLKANVNRNV